MREHILEGVNGVQQNAMEDLAIGFREIILAKIQVCGRTEWLSVSKLVILVQNKNGAGLVCRESKDYVWILECGVHCLSGKVRNNKL